MPNWFNLGKNDRSKFGRFLDKNELSQQEVVDNSKVSKSTISRLCQNDGFQPNMRTASKIIKAIRNLTGKNVDYDDFWSM
ncbi:helix-turn-helix transcriptional regulator [Bacillus tianshenii]|uniref:helix-turn-helix domain-containing protein n=1 Tax=Sutcliffiella tianshenii TaxID=1463404 RepID=UPI001CD6A577|nr:helix-turn-helix transcriptional regulator [Bacillus tianshenii]MCA1319776.1 helix-turn-helix transcriptional regulator [Bacillus tianshenii]